MNVASEVLDAPGSVTPEQDNLPILAFESITPFEQALKLLEETVGLGRTYDMSSKDDAALARKHRDLCQQLSAAADTAYERWNRPYLDARTANIAIRDFFKWAVDNTKAPIVEQITAEAKRKKAEKEAKDKAEADRIHAHRVALADINAICGNYVTAASTDVAAKIAELSADGYLNYRNWQESDKAAAAALTACLATMQAHLSNAQSREALAALQAQQAEAESKRQAEQKRADDLRARLRDVEMAPQACINMPSSIIEAKIAAIDGVDPFNFEELAREANTAKTNSLATLRDMLVSATQAEADAQVRETERAEQQRQADDLRRANEAAAASARAAETAKREAAEKEQRQAALNSELNSIQQQTIIATIGRAGVRAGGTIQCLRDTLAETKAWPVEAKKFGDMLPLAKAAKDKAVAEITQLLNEAEAREAEIAEQEGKRAAALARLQLNAERLLMSLREVVAYAREHGHDWLCLKEAECLVKHVEGGAA